MALIETIKYPDQNRSASLNGTIAIENGAGRMIIRDPVTGNPRNVQDMNGSHYSDEEGREMTLIDTRGVNTIEPATQVYRGRFGIVTTDSRPFAGFSKDDLDIRTLLGEQ